MSNSKSAKENTFEGLADIGGNFFDDDYNKMLNVDNISRSQAGVSQVSYPNYT